MSKKEKLNILFVFGYPLHIGGHFRSALAFTKNLISLGHDVSCASPGGDQEEINEFLAAGASYFPIPEIKKTNRFPNPSGASNILNICRGQSIDIVHVQDANSIAAGYLASIFGNRECIFTKAGGPADTTAFPPPHKIKCIFYSQELLDGMTKLHRLSKENISLIRARIDLTIYKKREIDAGFLQKYKLPRSGKKIVMAMRLNHAKKPWIDNLIHFARRINLAKTGIKIIIAGEGPLFAELEEQASNINMQSVDEPLLQLTGPIAQADEICQLYNYADIVIGNGRGIMEAMACKKPVLILGENGEGELVNAGNICKIAEFNFSGRHFRYKKEISPKLADFLGQLSEKEQELRDATDFSYEYIRTNLDAAIGARQLLEVYKRPAIGKNSLLDYFAWYAEAVYYSLRTSVRNRFGRFSYRKKAFP